MGEAFICRRGGGSIGNKSILYVTIDAGSVVTCTKDSTVKTKIATDGTCKFTGLDIGTWTIKGTKDGIETSTNIVFDKQEVKYIELGYFTATILATFEADCTLVTCTKGDTVLSVPSGELINGTYTFTVHEIGEWTLYATNEAKEKITTVNVVEETEYHAALTFEFILFDNGNYAPETGGWNSINGTKLSLSASTTSMNGQRVYRYTKEKVDLTEYSTAHFLVDSVSVSRNGDLDVGFSSVQDSTYYYVVKKTAKRGENTLDISSINGEYYAMIFLQAWPPENGILATASASISKIWLT